MASQRNPRKRTTETDDEWAEIKASSRMRRTDESDELWQKILMKRRQYARDRQKRWRSDPANTEKVKAINKRANDIRKGDRRAWDRERYVNGGNREAAYRNRYGIDLADVAAIAEHQNNRCAICGREGEVGTPGKRSRLCVDHNHRTGAIRGLLCTWCNVRMGVLDDDEWLAKAAAYRADAEANPPLDRIRARGESPA